jgi:hypothetical protein
MSVSMFLFSNLWGQNSDGAYEKKMLRVVKIVLENKSFATLSLPCHFYFCFFNLQEVLVESSQAQIFLNFFSLKIAEFLILFIWTKNLIFWRKLIWPNLLF